MLSLDRWHLRYTQQAAWTQAARQYLYQKSGSDKWSRILEVGSGTGAILRDFSNSQSLSVFGIDIQTASANFSKIKAPFAHIASADGNRLPFPENQFDCTLCHYFLLWCTDPEKILLEMVRVTRPGGSILLLAEPDYSQRIDRPDELIEVGKLQTAAVESQGADIHIGSHLGEWLCAARIKVNLVGLLASEWIPITTDDEFSMEWEILSDDLKTTITVEDFSRLKTIDKNAYQNGTRVLYIPTFYAWGTVIK
jgi:SAM-dependent methyltransferase